jgi:8-oxo-dGTP diphosphatase
LEEGEDPIEALERELHEELGMKIENIVYLDRHEHEYEWITIELIAYSCDYLGASLIMTDHDSFAFAKALTLRSISLHQRIYILRSY